MENPRLRGIEIAAYYRSDTGYVKAAEELTVDHFLKRETRYPIPGWILKQKRLSRELVDKIGLLAGDRELCPQRCSTVSGEGNHGKRKARRLIEMGSI